jgi:glycosyltransferase involved in cell wall biosynthesis
VDPKVAAYFQRFGFCGGQITSPPHHDLKIVVVIPCYNESDLLGTLSSLKECQAAGSAVEVIVVINSGDDGPQDVLKRNRCTYEEALAWSAEASEPRLQFHILNFPALPARHAGVGLARKIGMDEAVRRLDKAGNLDAGVIVGLDADCTCATNYLVAIERHFVASPATPGCSLYFEHPLDGSERREVYEAAATYELHLRYYIEALRYAQFPHAFHTVGSCMAIRAQVYMEQGGMNKRQAGEDFYFLHKIIQLGGFSELSATTVYPSPRASDRVPFGTGKAVAEHLSGKAPVTYALDAFVDMREFLRAVFTSEPNQIPESASALMEQQRFPNVLDEIRKNTSTPAAFQKRFFRWFDGFKAMKLVHHLCERSYGRRPVYQEAERLLYLIAQEKNSDLTPRELLECYRRRQRKQSKTPFDEVCD